jgi:chromosome segregation ATPase
VSEVKRQQVNLQRDHIKNENRVNYATEAAIKAKAQADNANTELYHLNKGFQNVSEVLAEKTTTIGGAKDLAMDLQKRANDLAGLASNKLSFLSDVESEFEDNERKLNDLSAQLVGLNCNMLIHLQVIEDKANYHRTCTPPGTFESEQECTCPPGAMEPECTPRSTRRDVSYNR